jgi:hypothetical protein
MIMCDSTAAILNAPPFVTSTQCFLKIIAVIYSGVWFVDYRTFTVLQMLIFCDFL